MAVACRALKNGVVDEIGRYKGTHGGKELHAELTALSASKKKYLPVPEAGSIAQEDLERMFKCVFFMDCVNCEYCKPT